MILAVRGGARGHMEQHKNRENIWDAPSCILFSSPLQLVFNNLLLVCGFLVFFSVKSPMNVCSLLPTATCGQELGYLNYIGICIKDHLCLF